MHFTRLCEVHFIVQSSQILNVYVYIASTAAPISVSISEVSTSSITFQWDPVDCIHRNGDITGYLVRYGVEGDEGMRQTESTSATEHTITRVEPSTTYSIQVAAVNSAGNGVYSNQLSITTAGIYKIV